MTPTNANKKKKITTSLKQPERMVQSRTARHEKHSPSLIDLFKAMPQNDSDVRSIELKDLKAKRSIQDSDKRMLQIAFVRSALLELEQHRLQGVAQGGLLNRGTRLSSFYDVMIDAAERDMLEKKQQEENPVEPPDRMMEQFDELRRARGFTSRKVGLIDPKPLQTLWLRASRGHKRA